MKFTLLISTIYLFLTTLPLPARDLHVPDDFGRIQEAVDAASTGDRIILAPKTYRESVLISDKAVILASRHILSGDENDIANTHLCGLLEDGEPLEIVPRDKHIAMLKAGQIRKDFGKYSDHRENFINAIRGVEQTRSPFSVSGPLSQLFALGCSAQRLGGVLEFDRDKRQITNNSLANSLLKDEVRKDWEQYYRI